jgi:hypothetical protein
MKFGGLDSKVRQIYQWGFVIYGALGLLENLLNKHLYF